MVAGGAAGESSEVIRKGKKTGFVGGNSDFAVVGVDGDFGIGFPVKVCHVLIITWVV